MITVLKPLFRIHIVNYNHSVTTVWLYTGLYQSCLQTVLIKVNESSVASGDQLYHQAVISLSADKR